MTDPSQQSRLDPDLLSKLQGIGTAELSDNLDRMNGIEGLRSWHAGGRMVGMALTVRTRAGDNRAVHEALALAGPGDVIVVDGGGDVSRALIGEIMVEMALARGIAGFVIDGAIRDSAAIAASSLPCFARAAIHRGPYKLGPGQVNVPVSVGGWVVLPGDVVVGDADGVVSFSPAQGPAVVEAALAQQQREAELIRDIRAGARSAAYSNA